MQLYIQKWGRRVGFDLNVQPSDEALTHAIIQVLLPLSRWSYARHQLFVADWHDDCLRPIFSCADTAAVETGNGF